MNQKHAVILLGAVLIILLLAVEFTAPPTNSNGTRTFSNGGISFEYPQDLSESSVLLDQIATLDFEGMLHGNTIGNLISEDAGYNLQVDRYSLSSFYANSTQDVLDEEKAELKDVNSSVLSENTTNANGLAVHEMLVYSNDTDQKTFFAIVVKDQRVCILQFNPLLNGNAEQSSIDDLVPAFQKIVSTVKVD
jgi:hypothetical protein